MTRPICTFWGAHLAAGSECAESWVRVSSISHLRFVYLPSSLLVIGSSRMHIRYKMRAFLCDTRTWGRGSAPLERGHRPCRLSWDKKVVVTGFCHSRVPSKGGTEVHCHSGDSFLSVSLMLLLGSCIFTKIPALLDCGYIPTLPLLRCFT